MLMRRRKPPQLPMGYQDLPEIQFGDPSDAWKASQLLRAASEAGDIVLNWTGKSAAVVRLLPNYNQRALELLDTVVNETCGIALYDLQPLRENMWLEDQVRFFRRLAQDYPASPRHWKLAGAAHLLLGYFNPKQYSLAAESYAECIRRIANYSEGPAFGVAHAGLRPSSPNHCRFYLALALIGLEDFASARFHLRLTRRGVELLEKTNGDNSDERLRQALKKYQEKRLGRQCLDRAKGNSAEWAMLRRQSGMIIVSCIGCSKEIGIYVRESTSWKCPICGAFVTVTPTKILDFWHPVVSGKLRPKTFHYEPLLTAYIIRTTTVSTAKPAGSEYRGGNAQGVRTEATKPSTGSETADRTEAEKLYADAMSFFQEGKLREALKQLDAVSKLSPEHMNAAMMRGYILATMGKLRAAINAYRMVLRYHPTSNQSWYELAMIHYGQRKFKEAKAELAIVSEISPRDVRAYRLLGKIAQREGKLDQAIALYRRTLQLDPSDQGALLSIFVCLGTVGWNQEALDVGLATVKYYPDLGEAHFNLGVLYFRNEMLAEAVKAFENAARLLPADADSHANLAMAYIVVEELGPARREAQLALQLDPRNRLAKKVLANLA